MRRGMLWLAPMLGVTALLVGGAGERVGAQRTLQIVVFTEKVSTPYWNGARVGADKAGRALGVEIHHVAATADSIEEQTRLVEEWIGKKPDAFVFGPVDDKALVPSVEKVNKARIPVVNFGSRLADGYGVAHVGWDDETIAYEIAKHAFKAIGNEGKVVYIEGASPAVVLQKRKKGFRRALNETPRIKPLGFASYRLRPTVQAMEILVRRFPEADAVICANDDTALMVVQALEAADRRGKTTVVGIDATPEAAEAILKGRLLASADSSGHDESYLAVTAAVKHLRGEKIPSNIMLPVVIVDTSKAKTWALPLEGKPVPDWNRVVSMQK